MRVALGGFASGPALPSNPEHIGGLLSVAASPLERSADNALELLAAMPAEASIIATYVLRSLPVGITSLQGDACNPPETGFGPRDKNFPGLGTIRWQPSPSLLDASFQQFLLDKPAAWLTPNQVVDQLIQSAKKAEAAPVRPRGISVRWSSQRPRTPQQRKRIRSLRNSRRSWAFRDPGPRKTRILRIKFP
jgi:hypothetical protein